MAVKIYNRLSEDSIGRDSKIQELNYMDEYDIKRTPEYGVTNVDGMYPITRDWFGGIPTD